jgi:hypothetical protein
MEQRPSSEANSFSASQEIPRILWNPEVHYAFTTARHLSLSWTSLIQSMPHPTSWRSILILSSHLRLGLPSGRLPSGLPTKSCMHILTTHCQQFCLHQYFTTCTKNQTLSSSSLSHARNIGPYRKTCMSFCGRVQGSITIPHNTQKTKM